MKHSAFIRTASLAAIFALLSACTIFHPPPPYLPSRGGIMPGQTITVQGEQNIYAIAQAHNVSMRDLIVLNNLQPPFTVTPGQSLVLPAGGSSFAGSMPVPTPSPLEPVQQSNLAPITPPAVSSQALEPVTQPQGATSEPLVLAPAQQPPQKVATTVAPQQQAAPAAAAPRLRKTLRHPAR
ncbi:MAG: LysM peptidoglycan-binding domain-containing protein, partial [Alphaproteobacteria bacterium]|nr:LysM peptidoglycan-binding domain-containing protein [Alphaproteobacteria bacterium]